MREFKVIRTDEKADKYGSVAFTGQCNLSSDTEIRGYAKSLAEGDKETVGEFIVIVKEI